MALAELAELSYQYEPRPNKARRDRVLSFGSSPKTPSRKIELQALDVIVYEDLGIKSRRLARSPNHFVGQPLKSAMADPKLKMTLSAVSFVAFLVVCSSLFIFLNELASNSTRFLVPSFTAGLLFAVILTVSSTVKKRLESI